MTAKFTLVDKTPDPMRKIGMGANPNHGQDSKTPKERFIGWVKGALTTPNYTVPSIENVRIHYDGPLSDNAISTTFSAGINVLGASQDNPPPGAVAVESTMAEPGKFQTPTLITHVGWHFIPEPLVFTAKGNAWTMPTSTVNAPVSPDAFDHQDDIGVNGPLGAAVGSLNPAWLDWGAWQQIAAYHMANAYNIVWQMGNRTFLMRQSLRNTMWVPGNAQNGSASSSEQDIQYYARIVNNYYRANFASNTPQTFLPLERTRIGNMILTPTGGVTTTGLSVFRPTRAYETVGVTYGAMGIHGNMINNQEFQRLTSPFLMKPGVPIGLRCDVAISASSDQIQMQNWLSATDGFTGATPPNFQVDSNLNPLGVTAGGAVGMEPSLDATVAAQPVTTLQNRVNFKGGSWKLATILKGWELTDTQAGMIADPSVQAALASLGCAGPQNCGGYLPA